MRKWSLIVLLLVGLALALGGTVLADNGPHVGDFNPTTDACAGCHRAHRGQTGELLVQASQTNLCYSCHANGAGADTDVKNGVYMPTNEGLRGGGFEQAIMDTDVDGNPTQGQVTSNHTVDVAGMMWGNGDTGAGKANVVIQCGSCHNPHGFVQKQGTNNPADVYRILRPQPKGSGAGADVFVAEDTSHTYTIGYTANNFRDASYADNRGLTAWCSQCHTRYMSGTNDQSGIFKNRHKTNETDRKCVDCHVAHGTSASMSGQFSASVELPDGTAGGGASDSRLLAVDNRGVCYKCHPSPGS